MNFKDQLNKIKNELKTMVGDGDLPRSISSIEARLNQNCDLYNEFLLVKSQYSLIEAQKIKGIIKIDDYNIELNRISDNVLQLIDRIEYKSLNDDLSINDDYLEDWGILDYFDEYLASRDRFNNCQEQIKVILENYSLSLKKNTANIEKAKSSGINNRQVISSLTLEAANITKKFSKELEEVIQDFDISLNRTVYFSLKIIEFQLLNGNKTISLSQLKSIKTNNDKMKKGLKQLEEELIKSKKDYLKRTKISKEYTLAMKTLSNAHDKFAKKCNNSIILIDSQTEAFSITIAEYLYNKSVFYRIMSFLHLDHIFRKFLFEK